MPFEEGRLPVKYLGVPLISTRLNYRDCKCLVDRMEKRVDDWKNKFLSFAGRLQLVKSVLSSLYIYWAAVFSLPAQLIYDLERKMQNFLWSSRDRIKGRHKVSWARVCKPKEEGGLGIRRIKDMNNSLLVYHLWSVIIKRDSLWVKWTIDHRVKGSSIWNIRIPSACSWGWRKILQVRPLIRGFIWHEIGNGESTSMWFDRWNDCCPLAQFISPRDIHSAGLDLSTTVADMRNDTGWIWPDLWLQKWPCLTGLEVKVNSQAKDLVIWKDSNGCKAEFSAAVVWNSIRERTERVEWANLTWYSQNIPKHAFNLWLIMMGSLTTLDKYKEWKIEGHPNSNMYCYMLCKSSMETQDHLFMQCTFSTGVWASVKKMSPVKNLPDDWEAVVKRISGMGKSRSVACVISKLLLGAFAYHVWKERNGRVFRDKQKTQKEVADEIIINVSLKIMSLKFKRCLNVEKLIERWQLPRGRITYIDDNG